MISCLRNPQTSTIKYIQHYNSDSQKATTYVMRIPKGYKLITLRGGHQELEKQFVYPDSSKIYITNFTTSSLNESNIRSLGDSISNSRFDELKVKIRKELDSDFEFQTMQLEGKAHENLIWKDIRVDYISIGYVGVQPRLKAVFDQALSSLRKSK